MPNMELRIPVANQVNPMLIQVEVAEPHRCELFRDRLQTIGGDILNLRNNQRYARLVPAFTNHGGGENLSGLLSVLAKILDVHVAPAIAHEVGADDAGNQNRAFYWQGVSAVDAAADNVLDFLPDTDHEGRVAYYRFLQLAMDRNFDPTQALPGDVAVNGRNPAAYRGQGIVSFYARHADLAARADTIANNFSAYLLRLFERLLTDWADIQRYFFSNQNVANLERIDLTGSDTHKGGSQVAILNLAGGRRLVYKPSDVEWDALIVGDVTTLAGMRAQLQGNAAETVQRWEQVATNNGFANIRGLSTRRSLAQVFNSFLPNDFFGTNPPQLRTYKILPCDAGSVLRVHDDHSRRIRSSYGYIEFLVSTQEGDRTFENTTCKAFKEYGYQIGQWQALMMLTNITDMHQENLFICDHHPYPIDMEITSFGHTNDPDATQLVAMGVRRQEETKLTFHLDLYRTGLSYRYVKEPNDQQTIYLPNLAFTQNGDFALPRGEDISKGFREAYKVLTAEAASFSAFLMSLLSGVVVRRLAPEMGTDTLLRLQTGLLGRSNADIQNECGLRGAARLGLWDNKAVQWRGLRPPHDLIQLPEHVVQSEQDSEDINTQRLLPDFAFYDAIAADLINGDVPSFYQVYGERKVMDSSGNLIRATAGQLAPHSGQTVQQLYPWNPQVAGGFISNLIPRPQVAVQVMSLRRLLTPLQSNYDKFVSDVSQKLEE